MFCVTALTVYYMVANVMCFYAYREWKYELHLEKCGCQGEPGQSQAGGGFGGAADTEAATNQATGF